MPLLALFSKKNRSSSKVSTVAHSTISIDDDEYVAVTAPSQASLHAHPPASSSSKLALPFRRKHGQALPEHQSRLAYSDPLLDPPPRRSSIFQTYQDDPNAYRSTHSLPDDPGHPSARPKPPSHQLSTPPAPSATKKSMFPWSSHRDRGKSVSSAKSGSPEADTSFNLKSFRHVRPDSPGLVASGPRSSCPAPPVVPIPTSTVPSPPVSFQVTSRRPRGNSVSEPTNPGSSPGTASQQRMAVGAFRQAARRSSTSLSLGDSPLLSPVRTSLDDRPPPSLLLPSQASTDAPSRSSRPQPPSATYTPKLTTSPISPTSPSITTSSHSRSAASPSPKPTPVVKPLPVVKPPRTRTNAFADTSSSSSSSEEDEEESTSDVGVGPPRISRRRTIKQSPSQLPTLPPSVRQQIQRATPPVSSVSMYESSLAATNPPRPQSYLTPGTRPRASLSVGALTPSAKETRASIALAANARLANSSATPKATPRPLTRNLGSDTDESAQSGSDSEEDAPLSSLVLPRRPGTSHSSHSTHSTARKPLVDLDAPSTLTGRPVRAPPPLAKDDERRPKPKGSVESGMRSRTLQATGPQSARNPQARVLQGSQGTSSSNSRASQAASARTTASYETPTTPSFSGSSGRLSSVALGGGSDNRLSVGNKLNLSPVAPPTRPFARRESPASSTGSSSGKAPLTPRDGSDTRSVYTGASAMSASKGRPGTHGRKPSVTFEDEKDGPGKGKQRDSATTDEARRRERRRSEARAAIELGHVVNGPPPVDEDDLTLGQQSMGMQAGWQQPGVQMPMQMQMPAVPPMYNMGMAMPPPGGYFPPPAPGADPASFLVAHQQAMAIAKQTFQYAVAQQALAAANEEWERSSTMTGFSGPAPAPQWGYGMGMRQSPMFPAAPRSMYAGSAGGGTGGWGGTGSVYGNSFGPAAAAGGRTSTYSLADMSAGAQRAVRPRTKTAPSAATPPPGTPGGRLPVPPSSYRGTGR